MKKSKEAVQIREALRSDSRDLAYLRSQVLDGGDVEALTQRFELEITKSLNLRNSNLFIAQIDKHAVGYGRVQLFEGGQNLYDTAEALPPGWYLRGLVVPKPNQKMGIATLLTDVRLNWLRKITSSVLCFLDSDEKKTIPMYERYGFVEVSRSWKFLDQSRSNDSGILLRHEFR